MAKKAAKKATKRGAKKSKKKGTKIKDLPVAKGGKDVTGVNWGKTATTSDLLVR